MHRKSDLTRGSPPGLLDSVAAKIGCIYLSDLHRPENWPGILEALSHIDPQPYSLYEWNDAVHYITGGSAALRDKAQALQLLRRFLREHSVKKKRLPFVQSDE